MGKVANFLLGTIVGAAIGASLAILLAPASGDELRGQLQERAKTFQIEIKNAASTRRAELEQQLANLRAPQKSA